MKKNIAFAFIISVLTLNLTACGFQLRGYHSPMSVNIPTTTLVFGGGQADIAIKNALKQKLDMLSVKTTSGTSDQTPSITVRNLRIQTFQLRGVLTEIRMVMSADVSYHISQNGTPVQKTNTIQIQRSYQYDQANLNIDNPQAEKIQDWLYDNLAERIADQYMALSLPKVSSQTLANTAE